MTPLRVSARLGAPIVYFGDGLYLDSLVALACYRDMEPEEQRALPPLQSAWADDFELPLQRWAVEASAPIYVDDRLFEETPEIIEGTKHGRIWGWRSSAVCAKWLQQGTHTVRKRTALKELSRYSPAAGRVQTASGRFKSWQKPYPTRFACELVWYCVGELAELERLLSAHVTHIGKLGGAGLGRVLEWAVEPIPDDYSLMRGEQLMRVMPFGYDAVGGIVCTETIRPPYHHRSREVPARRPDYEELRP